MKKYCMAQWRQRNFPFCHPFKISYDIAGRNIKFTIASPVYCYASKWYKTWNQKDKNPLIYIIIRKCSYPQASLLEISLPWCMTWTKLQLQKSANINWVVRFYVHGHYHYLCSQCEMEYPAHVIWYGSYTHHFIHFFVRVYLWVLPLIYCRVPEGQGLQQSASPLSRNETRSVNPLVRKKVD